VSTIIVANFNTTFTSVDRSSRMKISRATEILNNTIEKLDLIYVFRTLLQKKKTKKQEYTFFSNSHGTFSRIDHIP